ncbi:MAG TPA: hypothetical protein VMT53_07320 [Terriglobales bacterium]|nr:hypothetical protein [Terriglobales bacterium]
MSAVTRTIIAIVFLLASTIVFAQNVSIVAPIDDTSTSPVHVAANFSNTAPIDSITVLVDGRTALSQTEAVTPLDVYVPMASGSHVITVNAMQSDGLQLSASKNVDVASTSSSTLSAASVPSVSSSGGVSWVSDIEEKSGWYTYPDQGNPVCSSKPALISTPSLDGVAGKFYLGPKGQFNNCLWPILLGSSTTATHFTLDAYYRLSDPSKSQGVEFSSNKHIGTKWYKFSVQCSYNKGIFSVWDTAGGKWVATSIPCYRPSLNKWDHLTVNTEISNGKAVFLSLTFNGKTHTINKSFYPLKKEDSYSYGVHFQMDGNRAGNAYYTYVDNFKYTLW